MEGRRMGWNLIVRAALTLLKAVRLWRGAR
jgi:hypothetical protein